MAEMNLFEACKYSIEDLDQFRDENGFIDLSKAGVSFQKGSREIIRE